MPGRRGAWAMVAVSAMAIAACGGSPVVRSAGPRAAVPPVTSAPEPVPVPATLGAPSTPTSAVPPAFRSDVSRVTAADLPSSWRSGCPVGPDDLRLLSLPYWGFDDRAHTGSIVVRASVAQGVVEVFHRLYEERFPVRRMEPVDVFGGSDDASMAADNTSGFNCRNAVSTGPPHWSAHAYGEAIDVNPVENPYLEGGRVLPPEGAAYKDRSAVHPGMAVRASVLNAAFAAAGWYWGGLWASPDYQHFSTTGG